MNITPVLEEIIPAHEPLIRSYLSQKWGSSMSVSLGKVVDAAQLPGFVYLLEGQIVAMVTYQIVQGECEIVTLNSELRNHGLASDLIEKVVDVAKEQVRRIWLITTNDNANAIRFYQKRGFEWVAFHRHSMQKSRAIKPEIPLYGEDNIPIEHELEFALML